MVMAYCLANALFVQCPLPARRIIPLWENGRDRGIAAIDQAAAIKLE
jgi:hypothetical protein